MAQVSSLSVRTHPSSLTGWPGGGSDLQKATSSCLRATVVTTVGSGHGAGRMKGNTNHSYNLNIMRPTRDPGEMCSKKRAKARARPQVSGPQVSVHCTILPGAMEESDRSLSSQVILWAAQCLSLSLHLGKLYLEPCTRKSPPHTTEAPSAPLTF